MLDLYKTLYVDFLITYLQFATSLRLMRPVLAEM